MFRENIVVLKSASFDIGNTGANVATFQIPFKCSVVESIVVPESAVANSFTVTLDSYSGTTQGAADCGSLVVPDSAAANVGYYDLTGEGLSSGGIGKVLDRHSLVLVQVDEAGDSGENAHCLLVLDYLPETTGNDATNMKETA